jgi:hypothetical protein
MIMNRCVGLPLAQITSKNRASSGVLSRSRNELMF